MTAPNYRMYSLEQLTDALDQIDKDKFPERVKMIQQYLKNPGPRGNTNSDETIVTGENSEAVITWLSIELVFCLVFAGLGLLGYSVC